MKKVLVTGSRGSIGKILRNKLKGYELSFADLPEVDIRDYKKLSKECKGKNVIIHLAWKSKAENFLNEKIDPDNSKMFQNVYKAALENKVKRVIMASSVHAQDFEKFKGKNLTPKKVLAPSSPYGADKIFMESLGRYYSKKGLEVVCIRFGATSENCPPDKGKFIWLSGSDCANLIKKVIESKKVQGNFIVINGVSKNKKGIHSHKNPFGWKPKQGSGKKE